MGWTIGKHRIEVVAGASLITVSVDDAPPRPLAVAKQLGDFPLRIGKRDAIIRRVRNLDVARSELWIGDVCVPPSPDWLVQKLAPAGALCEGPHPESFRSAAAPAKYRCPTCRKLLCATHVAVDRVRCLACSEEASRTAALELQGSRRLGPLLGLGLGVFIAIVGVAVDVPSMLALGIMTVVVVFLNVTFGYLAERKEARTRRH